MRCENHEDDTDPANSGRLIDHGAALVFHHRWNTATNTTTKPYDLRHHALGPHQPEMATANAEFPPSPPNSCTKCSPPSPTPG
ncbi:hypothetical protein SALB_01535 [Streptomyces noursei]|uniref:Uncharacterized protein n=1 Tax=Streptomyces noursei TaxID=1971 RepID=A0A401QU93_STRNR|nr:hypothetical protein SALB_01535 [Streptomyces noursei]